MSERIDPGLVPKRTLYTGEEIPALGIGTFGSDKYKAEEIASAVYGAVKSGYRLIDGASVYQNEKEIGDVLKKLFEEQVVTRRELFVAWSYSLLPRSGMTVTGRWLNPAKRVWQICSWT